MVNKSLRDIVNKKLRLDAPLKRKTEIALKSLKHESRKLADNAGEIKLYIADVDSGISKEDPMSTEKSTSKIAKQCDIIIRHCTELKKASQLLWKAFESEYSPK